jgi:hypothetical protein
LEKTYRSVDGYLVLFAPSMSHHWPADAPMVLDAAAMRNSLIAGRPDPQAACIDLGSSAIAHLAQHYPHRVLALRAYQVRPTIERAEFDSCTRTLAAAGVAVAPDLEQTWLEFQSMHSRFAAPVATLTRMLPYDNQERRRAARG